MVVGMDPVSTPCVRRPALFDPSNPEELEAAGVPAQTPDRLPRAVLATHLCRVRCPLLVECRRAAYRSTDPTAGGIRGGRYFSYQEATKLATANKNLAVRHE